MTTGWAVAGLTGARIAAAILLLMGTACSEVDDDTVVWDLSLPWSIQEFHTQNAIRFAAQVEQATQGRLRIKVRPGAVLGIKGQGSLRAVEEGLVDMADLSAFQQVGTEPILGLESLPFLVDSHDDLALLYDHLRPTIDAALARHNVKVVYIVPWPNQNIYTKTRVDDLSTLRGQKMRTYDKLSSTLMERLGMVPVQMPSQDVVAALASGAIDAVMTSTTTGAAQKYWEFLDYIYRTNHLWSSNIMAVNKDSWEALPADVQATVERLARDLEPAFWDVSRADDQDKLKVLEANGMHVVEPSPALIDQMRTAARPMWREFFDAVPEAAAVVDAYLAARDRTS